MKKHRNKRKMRKKRKKRKNGAGFRESQKERVCGLEKAECLKRFLSHFSM